MFLSDGPHGPFYKLHGFRATCPMDGDNIKSLKIAGTLRYEVGYYRGTFEAENFRNSVEKYTFAFMKLLFLQYYTNDPSQRNVVRRLLFCQLTPSLNFLPTVSPLYIMRAIMREGSLLL